MVLLIPNQSDAPVVLFHIFTFHYGSTYTQHHPLSYYTHLEFTFHYGSTYTIPQP